MRQGLWYALKSAGYEDPIVSYDEYLIERGLSTNFMKDLQSGKLKCFLDAVKNDDALDMQIRVNTATIYYRGKRLCELIHNGYDDYIRAFNLNYAKGNDTALVCDLHSMSHEKWVEYIPVLKRVMDNNLALNKKPEDEFLQKVVRRNNCPQISHDTDFIIADTFSSIYTDRNRYIDMIAIKTPDSMTGVIDDAHISFIELKVRNGSLTGTSGIVAHFMHWHHFLCDRNNGIDNWKKLRDEVFALYNQKVSLGLIREQPIVKSVSESLPELLFLVANHNPNSIVLTRELMLICQTAEYKILRKLGCEVKIAVVSSSEYDLRESKFMPIETYIARSPHSLTIKQTALPILDANRYNRGKKMSKDEFLQSVSIEKIRERYEQLFAYTESRNLRFGPGTIGFSMSTNNAMLFYGYGDKAVNKRNSIETVRGKSKLSEGAWNFYKNELDKLSFFQPTKNGNLKWQLTRASSKEEMALFITAIEKLVQNI